MGKKEIYSNYLNLIIGSRKTVIIGKELEHSKGTLTVNFATFHT